ncbi:platelet-activating factor acetylhydrolase isoform II [Nonomuraea polychroma]|uniref:Platelet-activating factor acetylhydrolase isoform II n=1 Tax=Nonomuraea polychroma TaxID=46176 RepID=A0A438MM42_9ACTN|nr:alpha/beta hydrolase [Nonomuraea polychroma]RVX46699.1 platelet-activating factor acetylhydrolase isoform II [Nonomuraea polychroma]
MRHMAIAAGLLVMTITTSCAPASAPATGSASTDRPSRNPSPNASAEPPKTARNVTLALPDPTGSQPVGTTSLHLTDTSRPDPWDPGSKARDLMVSLWYPAAKAGGRLEPYMTVKESELTLKDAGITGVPSDLLARTRTHAFSDAPPAGKERELALVVLSPGFSKTRSSLTSLAEDLANKGYVVAAISHTHENVATVFPDGRVATCTACQVEPHDQAFWDKVGATRATDVSFVLDQLTGLRPRWKGSRLIDPARIAMAGHSVGGASSVAALLKDPRIKAGMNVDGLAVVPVPASGLGKPFLFLGAQATRTPGGQEAASWETAWQHLTGWKRWLVVAGAEHASFTDTGLLGEQAGLDIGAKLPAVRSMEITRAYVAAFLDLHLRGTPQPLLDQASAKYPEVKVCAVEQKSCA